MAEKAVANGIGKGPGGEDEAEARPKKRAPSGKTLACLVVLPVLLLGGLAAGGHVPGLFALPPAQDPVPAKAPDNAPDNAEERASVVSAVPLYYELPDLLVELENGGEEPTLLKIATALEVEDEATLERLHTVMPRVLDNFQVYLSELELDDLRGSAGFDRLSEALLLRVNASIRPAEIREVRLLEVLVQ